MAYDLRGAFIRRRHEADDSTRRLRSLGYL
jgi:hypothetical protein